MIKKYIIQNYEVELEKILIKKNVIYRKELTHDPQT
jgi:hypothetical protein